MKVTITGIEETIKLVDDIVTKYPYRVVVAVTEDVYKNATKNIIPHTRTGRLENNLDMRVRRNPTEGEVYIDDHGMMVQWKGRSVNYALFVHLGTAPHWIEARNKRSLRWSTVGGFAFAKKVWHTGYKGDPFMTRSAQETFAHLDKIFTKVYNGL